MSRQMSGGRKAYIMQLGKQAKMDDMVDIFDAASDYSVVVSVEEQKKFYQKWLYSLK